MSTHFGCDNELINNGSTSEFDEREALIESVWILIKITTKHGTHNPDDAVPPSKIEEITSGNKLVGEIDFNPDGTTSVYNARDEFYFKGLNEMRWSYENRFIRFKHDFGGFGFNIIWYGSKYMKWYIGSVNIHSGEKSVKIFELMALY